MICRICLQNYVEGFDIFGEKGINLNSAKIIAKYFWFEPKLDDEISKSVCIPCWEIIHNFHQLYIQAEQANSTWIFKIQSIKKDPSNDSINEYADFTNTSEIEAQVKDESPNEMELNEFAGNNFVNALPFSEFDNIKLEEEAAEDSQSDTEILQKKKRGRPSGSRACKRSKRKRLKSKEEIEEKDSEENSLQKVNKRTPEQIAAFNERVKEGDSIIANFMKIFCSICSEVFPSFTSLKLHSSAIHKQKGFIVCCDKLYFKRSKLVDHIEKHVNPEKYKCQLCGKVSMTRWTLKNHMKTVHKAAKNETLPYQCSICGKAFRLKTVMIRHQLIHIPEEERKFKCIHCEKSYPSQGTLNHHVRTYHERKYSGMCDICGKTYNNKLEVKRHRLEVHEGAEKTKYKCRFCDQLFATKYLCSRHKFEEHTHQNQVVEHKCEICNKTLANSEALKSHIQYAHKAKPKFECSLCGKSFKRELVLKEHMAAHTGQPLYACPHCPKTFTHSSNMHHHRKRVHPVEFEEARQLKDEKKESWCKITAIAN